MQTDHGLLTIGKDVCASEAALLHEWLETSGTGAYASSTLPGANTRRYHGLLVAPVAGLGRHVFLSWLEEWVEEWLDDWSADWYVDPADDASERGFYMSCARFAQGGLWPGPLVRFERGLTCAAHYATGRLRLTKEVFCPRGTNCVAVRYTTNAPCRLRLRPFFACRDLHGLTHWNSQADLTTRHEGPWQVVRPYPELPPVFLSASGRFLAQPGWYHRFYYPEEAARGFSDAEEDLPCPGTLRLNLGPERAGWLVAGLERLTPEEAEAAYGAELARREGLIRGRGGLAAQLSLAADQFLVETPKGPAIIAGYHWFEEWGRDALISLPGLLLADGRVAEAVAALERFATWLKDGLLPNRLLETGEVDYNSADSPLLFLLACQRVAEAAGGLEPLRSLWPTVEAIIEAGLRGTLHGIHLGAGGLPEQGAPGVALTWMDARIEGRPVTPRAGQAVELAALWYNGLRFAATLAKYLGQRERWTAYERLAAEASAGFNARFWNADRNCCYDVVSEEGADAALRPNQLFAVGLPYPLLAGERALQVLSVVERDLLTPYGLRSLAPGEPGYAPRYAGNGHERDRAYHQGTVWPWLLGIYTDARIKVLGRAACKDLKENLIANFGRHLREAGAGTISEVFDAEAPHRPGGCIAQAWSVAEIRRALALLGD
ncbi:MAG: amylo-alpha-1,6-glucosidase [Pseudomonadota bacterium]